MNRAAAILVASTLALAAGPAQDPGVHVTYWHEDCAESIEAAKYLRQTPEVQYVVARWREWCP